MPAAASSSSLSFQCGSRPDYQQLATGKEGRAVAGCQHGRGVELRQLENYRAAWKMDDLSTLAKKESSQEIEKPRKSLRPS